MKQPKIIIAGIRPGSEQDITPVVLAVVSEADVVVGYKYYFRSVRDFVRPDVECIDIRVKRERVHAEQAFEYAEQGKTVCVISSGDAGIYGMTPLIYEMERERQSDMEVIALSGISAFQKAASLLGAPAGHGFCTTSLSDLVTSWERTERRIIVVVQVDFVAAVYSPKSEGHYWQLYRLRESFLQEGHSSETPAGYVCQAGRDEQEIYVMILSTFGPEEVDIFTVTIISNSQTCSSGETMIIPRGYYRETKGDAAGIGQDIMIRSFRAIDEELKNKNIPLDHKWALFRVIHTAAGLDMEKLLYTDPGTVASLYHAISEGKLKTIVTDVTMVASGIRGGALQRLGVKVKCYLDDERVAEMAASKGITRTQIDIRLAIKEHPNALFVSGNTPTALMELCDLIRKERAHPSGIVAAPVGSVHVQKSKRIAKPFIHILELIVEGRKGSSNLTAIPVDAILCYPDAEQLEPGRDV